MGALQPWHIIVLAIVVVALFGYNKLPDVTRSVGRSLRIFKTEMKGLSEDDAVRETAKTVASAPAEIRAAASGTNLTKAVPVAEPVSPEPSAAAAPTAESAAPTTPGTV